MEAFNRILKPFQYEKGENFLEQDKQVNQKTLLIAEC